MGGAIPPRSPYDPDERNPLLIPTVQMPRVGRAPQQPQLPQRPWEPPQQQQRQPSWIEDQPTLETYAPRGVSYSAGNDYGAEPYPYSDVGASGWRPFPNAAQPTQAGLMEWLTQRGELKVPQIIALFWVIKLFTTALGESTSDYLVFSPIGPYAAVGLGFVGLVVALALQLSAKRYIAWVYWLAVTMVAIFGTMAADVIHVALGVPYWASCVFFGTCVAVVLAVWYFVEHTLSIHSIYTMRRELFYWATVMATFALGTAAGDLTAATFGLGYFPSVILFAILIALPALGFWFLGLNEVAAFWFAYIVTRPLGASIADWLGKPKAVTGVGLGDAPVSIALALLAIAVVVYLSITHADEQRDE